MAASFKQQCPSCEAMVLVKDSSQVGKKIDCPRCKYRFVVEAPKQAKESPEEAPGDNGDTEIKDETKTKPNSNQAVTTKKPGPAPAAPTIRKKAGPRKAEEADEAKPKKKKQQSSGSMVLVLGIGMSVCAVLLLGFGAYVIFAPPEKEDRGRTQTSRETRKVIDTEPEKKTGVVLAELTNLLPNDTQGILHFNIKDLVNGAVGRAAFETAGAFPYEFVEHRFGLRAKEVDQVIVAQNFTKDWVFAAIRTSKPINPDELKKNLNLQAAKDSPYRGQEYFTGPKSQWLDNLGRRLGDLNPQLKAAPPLRMKEWHLRFVDSQTLVVADDAPMHAFLDAKGQPAPFVVAVVPAKGKGPEPRLAAPAIKTYVSVNPKLKSLIEKMAADQHPLLCCAWEIAPLVDPIKRAADQLKSNGLADVNLVAMLGELYAAGICLHMRDSTVLGFGLEGKDPNFAKQTLKQFREKAKAMEEKAAFQGANLRIEWDGRPLVPSPAVKSPPGKGEPPPLAGSKIAVRTVSADQVLVLNVELPVANGMEVQRFLQPSMLVLRGLSDMAADTPRVHELAKALTALTNKGGGLPRGAYDRPTDGKFLSRPYSPIDRVSWMAELLPYLGHENVYKRIDFKQSWKSATNALPGSVLVPAFLDYQSPASTWWVRPPSQGGRLYGATHFVGIAGIGPDAVEYAAGDPAVAGKLGILGYDRATSLADIKDGASNTILMLQAAPTYPRPWLAGGGATLMGVPETNSIQPFLNTYGEDKKKGTYAIMADGSVRFISANISDATFKALCTMQGGEKVDVEKEAPKVPGAAQLIAQPLP